MSAAFLKTKQKALKEALGAKEWDKVLSITSSILQFDSQSYTTRVYNSLALFNLSQPTEAEASYRQAIDQSPHLPLAYQGLASLYEKTDKWDEWFQIQARLFKVYEQNGDEDGEKRRAIAEKTVEVRKENGSREDYITSIAALLPLIRASPAHPPPPVLPYLLLLRTHHSTALSQSLASETTRRRTRLAGPSLTAAETRRAVERDLMPTSPLPGILREILEDPDAARDEPLRREVESQLLDFQITLLKALDDAEGKAKVKSEVRELARGMVVVGSPDAKAWEVEMEWTDANVEIPIWRRFVELFAESGLAQIALLLLLPPSDPEAPHKPADQLEPLLTSALAQSPNSVLAHMLVGDWFRHRKDWEAVMQIAENGMTRVEGLQKELGEELPGRHQHLSTLLTLSLTYFLPPSNFPRARRLLTPLLSLPQFDSQLLHADATILSSSLQWDDAVVAWAKVGTPEAEGERGWALFKSSSASQSAEGIREALNVLEGFVNWCEGRKAARDEEKKEKEKKRSKEGIVKTEEEGETEEEANERGIAWWRVGECLWSLGDEFNARAFEAFQKSILAHPNYAPAYTSLGVYYSALDTSEKGLDVAFSLFRKAFELDGAEEKAAKWLAEVLAEDGDWGSVEAVARRVVGGLPLSRRNGPDVSWAWKAIGGSELNSKRYQEAIVAFQSALRGSPTDASTWIRLGVSYHQSGKHVAALKVFNRALTFDPDSWYAKFATGEVQRELGMLNEAVAAFRGILEERAEEMRVRVVLAETLLQRGQDEYRGGSLPEAESSFVEALEETVTILEGADAPRMGWKIAADALIGLGSVKQPTLSQRSSVAALKVLSLIEAHDVDNKVEGISTIACVALRNIENLASSGVFFEALAVLACKLRVLLETQNDFTIGSAWLDFGLALSRVRPHLAALQLVNATDEEVLHEAIRCIKYALHKEPVNSGFWNALGVLVFDVSPRLAQHSFIRAIEHSSRSAVALTNLGVFYLVHGDEELANEAFLKAQVLDPDSSQAWVGQATLATRAGHIDQAAILFEYASGLGGSAESDLGFAESAFTKHRVSAAKLPPAAERVAAVASLSAPVIAITRYLAQYPENTSALHLSALLLERVGDLTTAASTLEHVAQVLTDEYEADESPQAEARFIISQTTLGRVRLANDEYDGAVEAFEAAQSLLPDPETGEGIGDAMTAEVAAMLATQCQKGIALALNKGEEDAADDAGEDELAGGAAES